jgi:hypothetical protein
MKNQLCVSSYSVRQLLGPITFRFRGPDGAMQSRTWGEAAPNPLTLLEFPGQVREKLGIGAVEICQFHIPERTPAYLDQLKRAMRDAHVELINMPIDVGNISDVNAAYREEDLGEIEAWIQAAATLGSRMVRVNASMPFAGEAAPLEVTIDSYRRLAKTAESLGLQLLIENHGGITADPGVILRILDGVGYDHLKALVDIGNFEPLMSSRMAVMQGGQPQEVDLEPVYVAVGRIAMYAGLVHAKTHEFDDQGRPVGLDVVRALHIVLDTDYAGTISIEYEGNQGDPWENTRRTKALVEEAIA